MTDKGEIWQELATVLRRDVQQLAHAVYTAAGQLQEDRDVATVAAGLAVRCRVFSDRFAQRLRDAEAKAKSS